MASRSLINVSAPHNMKKKNANLDLISRVPGGTPGIMLTDYAEHSSPSDGSLDSKGYIDPGQWNMLTKNKGNLFLQNSREKRIILHT